MSILLTSILTTTALAANPSVVVIKSASVPGPATALMRSPSMTMVRSGSIFSVAGSKTDAGLMTTTEGLSARAVVVRIVVSNIDIGCLRQHRDQVFLHRARREHRERLLFALRSVANQRFAGTTAPAGECAEPRP